MAVDAPSLQDLSARRIIGFACNQAFVFFLLYMGSSHGVDVGPFRLERVGFVIMLFSMAAGFALVRLLIKVLGQGGLSKMLARAALYAYALVAALGSLLAALVRDEVFALLVFQGVLVGLSSALLLTAWGRAFGTQATRASVPEVFLGSLVAALLCLVFSLAPASPIVIGAASVLPLASVVNIEVPDVSAASASTSRLSLSEDNVRQARSLSLKMLVGTFLFGVAAGTIQLSQMGQGGVALPYCQVSMILFAAFLVGGLTLLLSDGFGRGAALNKSYRLAVFVMMVGVLMAPWPVLAQSPLPGESIVLAGYLGLEAVLISLFIVMAKLTSQDCALSFSVGFLALFAGQVVGAMVPQEYPGVMLAGIIILLSYVFLFTERDFDMLSQIVSVSDTFEETCASITEQYSLSARESEILAYALRGRTSERIAQELVISKSTVDTHLRRIYAKCGVHSKQELIDLSETV